MRLMKFAIAGLLAAAVGASTAAAQHAVHIDGDKITVRGCVSGATAELRMPFETLLWSRGGMLTAGTDIASAAVTADSRDLGSRVLYWIDDDDLAEHAGKMVEIKGDLGELKTGEIEIDRDGDFTEIKLELDGDEHEIRDPSAWLERSSVARASRDASDREIEIATRKVDVDEVNVLGSCPIR